MSSIDNNDEGEVVTLRRHRYQYFRSISTDDISSEDETQDILFPLPQLLKERLNSENSFYHDETEYEMSEDKSTEKHDLKSRIYERSIIYPPKIKRKLQRKVQN